MKRELHLLLPTIRRKKIIIEMISSRSKTSFAIDDLLCNNNKDQRTTNAPKPINDNSGRPDLHYYLQNGNRFPWFSQQIDHFNQFGFNHYPRLSASYMDLSNTFDSSKLLTLNLAYNISFHFENSEI